MGENYMSQGELNPELVKAISDLLPDVDPGLVRGMLRIYYQRRVHHFGPGTGHWELHQSPEGKISDVPRFVIVRVM
jgi:hypothetical protein